MNKRFKFLNGIIGLALGSSLLVGLMFLSACDKDDDDVKAYEWPGVYIFEKATLQTDISFDLDLSSLGFGVIPVSKTAPSDITDEMAGGLLATAPCTDPANGAVELKSNNELFFDCRSENSELKAGNWNYDDANKKLSLSLASPPLPVPPGINLVIENVIVNETNNSIKGTINDFPLTADLMLGFIPSSYLAILTPAQIETIKAGLPPVTLVDVDVEFLKIP
jgi:hypothetical protein